MGTIYRTDSGTSTAERNGIVRIAIVDDHELVRYGVAQLISREPGWQVCGEAADAVSAMQLIREQQPDLAIVDLRLAEGDGLELIKQIRAAFPEVQTLVSSMHDEKLYAERALRAGARGYVSKQESAQTLIGAIRQVLEGKMYLSDAMTERLLLRTSGRKTDVAASPMELLSDREIEVFELLGRGMNVKEIAQHLHLSPKTVEYHREHIKEKLQLPSSSAVLRHATAWTLEH